MCRHRVNERQEMQALSVAMFCMRVVDAFIRRERIEPAPHDAETIREAKAKLADPEYRNYCEAVIFEDKKKEIPPQRIIELMAKIILTKQESRDVVEYWHELQKAAHFYTRFDLPKPDFGSLFKTDK